MAQSGFRKFKVKFDVRLRYCIRFQFDLTGKHKSVFKTLVFPSHLAD